MYYWVSQKVSCILSVREFMFLIEVCTFCDALHAIQSKVNKLEDWSHFTRVQHAHCIRLMQIVHHNMLNPACVGYCTAVRSFKHFMRFFFGHSLCKCGMIHKQHKLKTGWKALTNDCCFTSRLNASGHENRWAITPIGGKRVHENTSILFILMPFVSSAHGAVVFSYCTSNRSLWRRSYRRIAHLSL